jgi:hypothetical protein
MYLGLSVGSQASARRNILVDAVLGSVASIGGEGIIALHSASEEDTEVFVQVGEESAGMLSARSSANEWDYSLLGGVGVVSGHVLHEGSSTATVEEVDSTTDAAASVCGSETAVEIWQEVDGGTVVGTWGEDAWDLDADVWLGVCDCQRELPSCAEVDVQLPMTAVLTTRVKRVFWLAAVLFFNRAVV